MHSRSPIAASSSNTALTRPPFYWKVPGIEKDYMFENVQRIRKTNAQNRLKTEPMKAAFIPGVTKNSKYAHITSRVGEILRNPSSEQSTPFENGINPRSKITMTSPGPPNGRLSSKSTTANGGPGDVSFGTRVPVNRRLSRSSTDLRTLQGTATRNNNKTGGVSNSASVATALGSSQQSLRTSSIGIDGPGNYVPRMRRKPKGLQIEDESVYNWRFSDNNTDSPVPPPDLLSRSGSRIKTFHKVEYLPCDGICADEVVEDRDSHGSGRSSSRTSRGCNTEETRIIEDLQCLELQDPPPNMYNSHSFNSEQFLRSTPNPPVDGKVNGTSSGYYSEQSLDAAGDRPRNDFGRRSGCLKNGTSAKSTINGVGSGRSSVGKVLGAEANGTVDLPHSLGTVPKYLKQRQEELRSQAADRLAQQVNPDVPVGHVLLSDEERLQTLADLKSKYALLIDELNRVPIRIDTMRVREYKIQLEQQLQKLEKGIAIFSRTRVLVKLPEEGGVNGTAGMVK